METIRAIVEGFSEGRIALPKAQRNGPGLVRHAPSFIPVGKKNASGRPEASYTAASLAKFTGKPENRVAQP